MKKIYSIDPFKFRVIKVYSLFIENEELPLLIEGIVGEHLARNITK